MSEKTDEVTAIVSECVQKLIVTMDWDLEPGLAPEAAEKLQVLERRLARYQEALKLLSLKDANALCKWARSHRMAGNVVLILEEGYRDDIAGGYRYRGALLTIQREVARWALLEGM